MLTVIIGAGIIGLHIARVLKNKGHEIYVLDRAPYLAEHTSGRNSGVIHAGIFYAAGSLKEKTCIEGNKHTYEWLQKLGVHFIPCGKWVVPEDHQRDELDAFYEKIRKLPVPLPEKYSEAQLTRAEPHIRSSEAIFVPSTGILDAAAYVKALAIYLENKGVQIILNCEVAGIDKNSLQTNRGTIHFDLCINSAGLMADEIAEMSDLKGYQIRPCRGDYYVLNKQPVSRPVYHLPYKSALGLGIHLTPTLNGQTLLGPNAFFIQEKEDYKHVSPADLYEKAARFYLPKLTNLSIVQSYSGNRPKLYYQGKEENDFVIKKKGNFIHLLGIESPGLTAAPALAEEVVKLI